MALPSLQQTTTSFAPRNGLEESAPDMARVVHVTNAGKEMTPETAHGGGEAQRVQAGAKAAAKRVWFDSLATGTENFDDIELHKRDDNTVYKAHTLSDSSAYGTKDHSMEMPKQGEMIQATKISDWRSVACRQGDCDLSVMIPSRRATGCCTRLVLSALSLAMAVGGMVGIAISHLNGSICDRNMIVLIAAICAVELCLLFWAYTSRAAHQQLLLTPGEFHIRRSSRGVQKALDSSEEKEISRLELSLVDHLFWKQISGPITDLTCAENHMTFDHEGETIHTLLVKEGSKKHFLGTGFCGDEIKWLVREINDVLSSIQSMHKNP